MIRHGGRRLKKRVQFPHPHNLLNYTFFYFSALICHQPPLNPPLQSLVIYIYFLHFITAPPTHHHEKLCPTDYVSVQRVALPSHSPTRVSPSGAWPLSNTPSLHALALRLRPSFCFTTSKSKRFKYNTYIQYMLRTRYSTRQCIIWI